MSLAETQQIMALLTEISRILDGIEVKTTKINSDLPRTEKSLANFRQLERVALRYLAIARRLGLPDEVNQAIQVVTQLIVILRMAQMSANMLMGGPAGIAMGIAGFALSTLAVGSMIEGY